MFDNYTYLSGELRHLAHRKSSEQTNWQNAIKQQHKDDREYGLDKLAQNNFLANLSQALHFQFNPWRRTHPQAPAMINDLPSRH